MKRFFVNREMMELFIVHIQIMSALLIKHLIRDIMRQFYWIQIAHHLAYQKCLLDCRMAILPAPFKDLKDFLACRTILILELSIIFYLLKDPYREVDFGSRNFYSKILLELFQKFCIKGSLRNHESNIYVSSSIVNFQSNSLYPCRSSGLLKAHGKLLSLFCKFFL